MTPARARMLLGVRAGAGADEIEAAFRRAAWVAHPDRGGDGRGFADLADARRRLLGAGPAPLAAPARPAQVVVRSDGQMARDRVERTVRRWVSRHRPRTPRRVV